VGRFLEHSRIFWFRNGGQDEVYVGSADLMERNLDRRVETLAPVRDPEILAHLRDVVLDAYLKDADRAMVLDSAGHYERLPKESGAFNAQQARLQHYTQPPEQARVSARTTRFLPPPPRRAGQRRRETRSGTRRAG